MDDETKQKYLEVLRSNDFFKFALAAAPSEDERRKMKAYAEDVFLKTVEGFSAMQNIAEKHPDKLDEAARGRIPNDSKDK